MNSADLFAQAVRAQQNGQLAEAEKSYRSLLEKSPDHAAAWVNLGQLQRQQGQETAAIASYQQALQLPDHPIELFFNLGNLYLQLSKYELALSQYDALLAKLPKHLPALQQQSRALRELGRLEEASRVLLELLKHQPDHHDALLERGNLERTLQRADSAQNCYQTLLKHDPEDWKGHYALARLLFDGEDSAADQHLNKAIQLAPKPADVLLPMAHTFISEGHFAQAKTVLQRLLRLDSQHLHAKLELASVLIRLGEQSAGEHIFQQLSSSKDIVLLTRLAEVLMGLNHWQQSLNLLRRVVELEPQRADVHFNLATSCAETWQMNEALKVSQKCRELSVEQGSLAGLIGGIHLKRGDVEAALADYRLDTDITQQKQFARLNFASLYSDQISTEAKAEQHFKFAAELESLTSPVTTWQNDPDPQRRLHLGYVSADLHHQHPVDIYMQPVFEHQDHQRFELTIYYSGSHDHRTHRARSFADHWVEVKDWPDERLMRQIENDRIDILIDLSGHTARNRLTLFARHPAPVQVSMVAYPHSTGLQSMDYFLGDKVLTPPEFAHLYSEKLLCLDHCIFCYPHDLHPLNEPRSERDHVVFGSFNNVPKLTPSTIRVWAKILHAVPHSRMLLKAPSFQDQGCVERYQGLFGEAGIHPNRLMFRGPTGLDQMMREYRDMDIALDPFPFNGGTTTQQALWAATPLVTLAGQSFNQRMGASILTHLGHPEWVAQSETEYVAIATELASDRKKLNTLQQQLPAQMKSSGLTDGRAYTQNLEGLLRQAWQQWCEQQGTIGTQMQYERD